MLALDPTNAKFAWLLIIVGGLTGVITLAWSTYSHRSLWRGWGKRVEPWHLQVVGNVGVIIFACVALTGLIWERYYWTPRSSAPTKTAISQQANADNDSELVALRDQIAGKNREIADLKSRAAKNKDPEVEKLRRITEWIALTERRRHLVNFQEWLPQTAKEADGFFDKIVNRQPSRHPDETPYFYKQRVDAVREGYLSLIGKDVPELNSDRFYRDHPIVAVPGETPDMPDLARSERRKKYAQHKSFMDGARVISERITFALEKLDKQLAELQREANEYMRIRNKSQT